MTRYPSTVTIIVKLGSGYELDNLAVTDKSGDTMKLTRKSDAHYTFPMLASKAAVEVTFMEVQKPVEKPPFANVPKSACHDAMAWVVQTASRGDNAHLLSPVTRFIDEKC